MLTLRAGGAALTAAIVVFVSPPALPTRMVSHPGVSAPFPAPSFVVSCFVFVVCAVS